MIEKLLKDYKKIMNKKDRLKQFLEDRNKLAISGKYEDYEKFCKKYNTPQAPNNEVFEIMIHKLRANITKGIPKKKCKKIVKSGY